MNKFLIILVVITAWFSILALLLGDTTPLDDETLEKYYPTVSKNENSDNSSNSPFDSYGSSAHLSGFSPFTEDLYQDSFFDY